MQGVRDGNSNVEARGGDGVDGQRYVFIFNRREKIEGDGAERGGKKGNDAHQSCID